MDHDDDDDDDDALPTGPILLGLVLVLVPSIVYTTERLIVDLSIVVISGPVIVYTTAALSSTPRAASARAACRSSRRARGWPGSTCSTPSGTTP